jgi:hypothetical protein
MQKEQRNKNEDRRKTATMKECSTYRNDLNQEQGEQEIIQNRNPLD